MNAGQVLMTDTERARIKERAITLIRLINEEVSVNPRSVGKSTITYKLKSSIFYEKLKQLFGDIDEITWVKILKFLREEQKFSFFYNYMIRVPFEHDGGSSMHFPEIYPGNGKILVKTLVEIKNPSIIYPEIPGIKDRCWKIGDLVYVPEERAARFIKIKWMEKVEEEN